MVSDVSPREFSPRDAAEALLRWYVDMGVDIAIDDGPHDRFAESAVLATVVSETSTPIEGGEPQGTRSAGPGPSNRGRIPAPAAARSQAAALSAEAAARSARELAASAATLDDLRVALAAFDGCSLKGTATQLVFADGDPHARIMFLGEAPGADEDRQGVPFVGRAGQLLDRMLRAIGLDRNQVYVANVVPWRPPGNRTPTPQETAICMPFTARQIALVDPDILVCLGNAATQSLLGARDGILKLHGRWLDYDTGGRTIKAMPMLHPAYLLRQPAHKKLAWQDLRLLRKAYDPA